MDIKALVIEDEPRARKNMVSLLERTFPELKVIGETASVRDSVAWLADHEPDVIFMDVELSDGNCFDIFRKVDIKAQVVMTTAYDTYAVRAFEVNSVDYLLKPVSEEDLRRAMARVEKNLSAAAPAMDFQKVMEVFQGLLPVNEDPAGEVGQAARKDRFIIRLNDRIVPVNVRDIAYFYSEAKNTYLVTNDGTSYVIDESLDAIEGNLDPERFFRISRGCIIAEDSIDSISKLLGGRLRIYLRKGIEARGDITVSRARALDFLSWLEK